MALIDVDYVLSQLTVGEKVSLLSGADFWHTAAVPRLGVPSLRCSDGPNGVRGTRFFNGVPSSCFPCATALASTFDTSLVRRIGEAIGDECIAKGVHFWLAPTMNTARSPLGGRGFESFSEDPILQGHLGSSIIRGVQSRGVGATQKHFVANDVEYFRSSSDSRVSEKALREIYLKPFEIVCSPFTQDRNSVPWATMTGYNRLNGVHTSENPWLLRDVLRNEWGWDGLIMSDWGGTCSTVEALQAGLDLEMPGPSTMRGGAILRALAGGKIHPSELDRSVCKILHAVRRAQEHGLPFDAEERIIDTTESRKLLVQAATESIVLLKNEGDILPLDPKRPSSSPEGRKYKHALAIIGPNSQTGSMSGGGSATLNATFSESVYDAFVTRTGLEEQDVVWAQGCYTSRYMPSLAAHVKDKAGMLGSVTVSFYDRDPHGKSADHPSKPLFQTSSSASEALFFLDGVPDFVPLQCYVTVEGTFIAPSTSDWEFGLFSAGHANLFLDDLLVVDNSSSPQPGETLMSFGSTEARGVLRGVVAGQTYALRISFSSHVPITAAMEQHPMRGGIGFGGRPLVDDSALLAQAVSVATQARDVVVVIGLNKDWESESFDRQNMALPAGCNTLVTAVLDANPRAVIVLQSGTPVTMPWLQRARAVLQAWYGGNAYGGGVANVVLGKHNPHARLPLTFPERDSDTPTHGMFPYSSHTGTYPVVEYSEGSNVGYRHYDLANKKVAFAFGHGCSYTSFKWEKVQLIKREPWPGAQRNEALTFEVGVTNVGVRSGREVVQLYLERKDALTPSPRRLVAFATTGNLAPGESEMVHLRVRTTDAGDWDDEAFPGGTWRVKKGCYAVHAAKSSRCPQANPAEFEVEEDLTWRGLVPALQ